MASSTTRTTSRLGLRIRVAVLALVAAVVLSFAGIAQADVSLVMDPSPPFTGTIIAGDFAESSSGVESYDFSGEASNPAGSVLRLLVRARANGAVVSGSEQTFILAADATTSFHYAFTRTGGPITSVGLEFESPDGTVNFVAGVIAIKAGSLAVPASGTWGRWMLSALLLLVGLGHGRRPSRGRPTFASA